MKIAILEDNKDRQAVMRACLADRFYQYEAHFFDEPGEMVSFLRDHLANTLVIGLDHDMELKPGSNGKCVDPGTGLQVAEFLAERDPSCPIIIHTTNSLAAAEMQRVLKAAGWSTRRVVPFDDLKWIESDWFPAVRRAIVGPLASQAVPKPRS